MDSFGKLLQYGTDWIIDGARRGDWGQVTIGLLLAAFGIGAIVYAVKVFGSASKSGERGVDLSTWELFEAARSGDKKMVLTKLNGRVDINKQDKDGLTPLMYACSAGKAHDEMIQLLIDKGADVNLRDKDGGTALMHAVMEGHSTIAPILIQAGADVNAASKDGITALKLAKDKKNSTMIELLEKVATTPSEPANVKSVQPLVAEKKHEQDYRDTMAYKAGKLWNRIAKNKK